MTWQDCTQTEKNALVHERVLGLPLYIPCLNGQIDEYQGSYWGCTCGWISDFYVGEDKSTEHEVAIPDYVGDWNVAWPVLRQMVDRYCSRNEDGEYGEIWSRFCYELDTCHAAPNIFLWIVTWTPELVSRASYRAITGEQA